MIDAVIIVLDLDGTLIDSARDIGESVGELLASYGAPPLPMDDIVSMVGDGAPTLVARALTRSQVRPQPDEALARYLAIYERRLMNHTAPYHGIAESLALMVRLGPLAVLTNKPLGPSIGILEALGLRGFFSRVIGGDGEYPRKPDPAGLLSLQSLAPGQPLVMVGDSPADWMVAEAAAAPFVFARYGFGASKFGARPPATDLVVEHPRQLYRVVASIRR
jgi:phosphoglycolate phosphatase